MILSPRIVVLGVSRNQKTSGNFNDWVTNGVYEIANGAASAFTNCPSNADYPRGVLYVDENSYISQVYIEKRANQYNKIWFRTYSYSEVSWNTWKEVSTDIPSFYKNYASLDELQTSLQVPIAKRYKFTSGVTVIKVDDYEYTNRESRFFSIGYDTNNKRSGLALIKENKEIEWLLKPNGWDNYFQLNVSDTEITVSRLGAQDRFYLFNISRWWL